jgi:hypothetical protein
MNFLSRRDLKEKERCKNQDKKQHKIDQAIRLTIPYCTSSTEQSEIAWLQFVRFEAAIVGEFAPLHA